MAFVQLTHLEQRERRLPAGLGLTIGAVASVGLWVGFFGLIGLG